MAITAALVKELRERTGAGMMECKKALVETNGDVEVAIENMRKSGQAKAAKKAGRIAAEGVILSRVSGNIAALLEVNSETDFVARDENFLGFANQVADLVVEKGISSIEELKSAEFANGETVETARENLVAKIGENITVRRVHVEEVDVASAYLHGNKIGVLVNMKGGDADLAKDVAMHVAASNPEVISGDDVSAELIEKEKEIFTAQALESGKPAEIIEKMIGGRINKFINEISLVGQSFVKDPSTTVGKLLQAKNASVISFTRFEVGEGIEKKEEDFAAEVMSQVKGN
jgi:elongation factor Ts